MPEPSSTQLFLLVTSYDSERNVQTRCLRKGLVYLDPPAFLKKGYLRKCPFQPWAHGAGPS